MTIRSGAVLQILAIGLTCASARASVVTWMLQDVAPFASGQTATGFFSIDQTAGAVVDWNIQVTGGTNPVLTNLTFRSGQSCLAFCVSPFLLVSENITGLEFRTPVEPDNTFNEFHIGVLGSVNALTYPSTQALGLSTTLFATDVEESVRLSPTIVGSVQRDFLSPTATSARITTSVVPEPRYTAGVGAVLFALLLMKSMRARRRT